jgi:ribonuclease inhibitor
MRRAIKAQFADWHSAPGTLRALEEGNMSRIEIDGLKIVSIEDFHNCLKESPLFPSFYGRNNDALWDSLTGLVELPLTIVWKNASFSSNRLGDDFDKVVSIMREVENQTSAKPERFELRLEE